MEQPTSRITAGRVDRGRILTESYGADLASLLTDLCAYADTLGSAAFANNVNAALARNGHRGASFDTQPRADYRCTVCDKPDHDHRFAPCDGGEWVNVVS